MERSQQVRALVRMLLEEMPEHRVEAERVPQDPASQRRLLRGLMTLRPPLPLREDFVSLQDALLGAEREEKGVVDAMELPATESGLVLWQGDITRLRAGAIVNAANSALLGCFYPCHGCGPAASGRMRPADGSPRAP